MKKLESIFNNGTPEGAAREFLFSLVSENGLASTVGVVSHMPNYNYVQTKDMGGTFLLIKAWFDGVDTRFDVFDVSFEGGIKGINSHELIQLLKDINADKFDTDSYPMNKEDTSHIIQQGLNVLESMKQTGEIADYWSMGDGHDNRVAVRSNGNWCYIITITKVEDSFGVEDPLFIVTNVITPGYVHVREYDISGLVDFLTTW